MGPWEPASEPSSAAESTRGVDWALRQLAVGTGPVRVIDQQEHGAAEASHHEDEAWVEAAHPRKRHIEPDRQHDHADHTEPAHLPGDPLTRLHQRRQVAATDSTRTTVTIVTSTISSSTIRLPSLAHRGVVSARRAHWPSSSSLSSSSRRSASAAGAVGPSTLGTPRRSLFHARAQ